MKRYLLFLIIALMGCSLSMNAQGLPIMSDTLHMDPPPGNIGPDKQTKTPEQYPVAEVAIYPGQMTLHFSEPVSCEIQLVDMEGHAVLTTRMRDEDIAILDVSGLHGRFQLIISSSRCYATKAYWFP